MGKRLVIVGFILSLALAVYVYLERDARSLRDNLVGSDVREPRIAMEDFTVYRYRDEALVSRITARLGHFYEPNVVELEGEIRGERLTPNGREQIGAESAVATFSADSMTDMLNPSKSDLVRTELSGFVEVGVQEHTLTTDYAEYVNAEKVVRSTRPVRVEGAGRVLTGEEGFTYSLASETLEMIGPIKGMVTIDDEKKR